MKMKKLNCILIFLLALILSGCCQSPPKDEPTTLRIISTAPSITEILYALELDEEIVGVSSLCNYPPRAKEKTKIGTFSRPNIEKIIELKPDIVFITGLEQAPVRDKLKILGINTVTIYPRNLDELYGSIREIGRLTNSSDEANTIIEEMEERINSIEERVAAIPVESRKWMLIEVTDNPLIVAGEDSFVGELGTIAGGRNIAYDAKREYCKFSPELVIERSPDCIILGYMFKDEDAVKRVSERLGWSNVSAVKKGAIFNDINPDILLRPGPRAQEAIEEIYKRLYGN